MTRTQGNGQRDMGTMQDIDWRDIDTWVFDLDNTLYPARVNLFAQIDGRMKAFVAEHLAMPPDEAFRLQKQYYHEYGTTLRGLMERHDIAPDIFLDYVHDIDHAVLDPVEGLAEALAALPGRRLVYTNGSEGHADAVLDRLGVAHLFEGIFDIKAGDYVPKPDRSSYEAFLRAHGVEPRRAVFFEDTAKNLLPAAALGMVTVLIQHEMSLHHLDDIHHGAHHVAEDLVTVLHDILAALDAAAPGRKVSGLSGDRS